MHLLHIYTYFRTFVDMILQMSEYSLMEKYSLVGFHSLILYDIIDGRYVLTGNLFFLSLFLLLSI